MSKTNSDLIQINNDKQKELLHDAIMNMQLVQQPKNIVVSQQYLKKQKFNFPVPVFSLLIVIFFVFALGFFLYSNNPSFTNDETSLSSQYLVQNLRGDTINTWASWNISDDRQFNINIQESPYINDERFEIIFNTVMSQESLLIDDNLMHKGPVESMSTHYLGWYGALNSITEKTKLNIPKNLHFDMTDTGEGDVIIKLTNLASPDGYSGFTQSIVDESNNQILKSSITIYDVERISNVQLETIVRHELGHAFGLAHSSAKEDLMYPTISTHYPYISDCTVDAITELYDGGQQSQVICEK